MDKDQFTDIWNKYEKSRDYLRAKNITAKTEENWRFFIGDQWHGIESGGERLPKMNFIKPVCKYKIATVSQHSMVANYSDMENRTETIKVCDLLNKKFTKSWEKGKMDTVSWKIIKASCIQGDSYIYYGTGDTTSPQIISNSKILLSDEQNQNLQEQKYIMLYERLFVEDIKKEARKNKIDESEIESICNDEETEYNLLNKQEIKGNDKCASILYMTKENGIVHIAKSAATCIYKPLTPLAVTDSDGKMAGGLKTYPLINFIWEELPDSARGVGEVEQLIANQIEVNKTYARRSVAVKQCAYPKLAYNRDDISNPEDLDKVGAKIGLTASAGEISKSIGYLNPVSTAGDAKNLSDDIINTSRDLAGAGDAATGIIDPEKASGTAINAVRDQAALPLNEQVATYKQFVENLALLWVDLWTTYNPNGFEVTYEEDGENFTEIIPSDTVNQIKLDVRIDVSADNPWTKFAEQQELSNLFQKGSLSLEEYIDASSDNSPLPKNKLAAIIAKRPQEQQLQAATNPKQTMIEQGAMYDMQGM